MNNETEEIIRAYVERAGQMFENFGFPRLSGEIGALLYLYKGKMSLDEIAQFLDISKGSVSTNTRFLMRMKYIKSVRVSGDRKDYYEFSGDLWQTLEQSMESFIRTQVDDFKYMNEQFLDDLKKAGVDEEDQIQRTHLTEQLSALNTLYKYLDMLRRFSDMLRITPVNKAIKVMKSLIGKK